MKTQLIYKNTDHKSRTSFYIYDSLTKKMNKLLPERGKTEFVNNLIALEIARIEKEEARDDLLKFMKTIKPVKINRSIAELVREVRNEGAQKISGKANMALIKKSK